MTNLHDNYGDWTETFNGPWGWPMATSQGDKFERNWDMVTGQDCEPTIPSLTGGGPNPDLWTCK